jgi:hypothetical protein
MPTNRIWKFLPPRPRHAPAPRPKAAQEGDIEDTVTGYVRIMGQVYEVDIVFLPEGWVELLDADLRAKGYLPGGRLSNGDRIYSKLVG